MPNSRADRPRRGGPRLSAAGPALAGVVLLAALPAAAQVGPPVPLLPPAVQPGEAPPASPPPAAATPAPATPASGAPAPATGEDIRSVPLAPVDASWVGSLPAEQGAFPAGMWQGTPRATVAAILPLLAPTTSPVLQDLARRLLLSGATAPAGVDAPDHPGLAALRFERLLALGFTEGAVAAADALPAAARDEALDRARVEARFAMNDRDAACHDVTDGMARHQNHWWDRALIACQALAGDSAKASLGLGLLREQKAPRDAAFDTLIATLGGERHKIEKLPDPTPLRVALLAATKQPLPADALVKASPAVLRQWATNEALPAALRLGAAERAAELGALPPPALGALYDKIDAKPEAQAAALKDGKPPSDPLSRAILYQAARGAQNPATRQAALAALIAEARKRGGFATTARLVAPLFADLTPDAAPEGFAADAARALLVAGQTEAAGKWIAASGDKPLLLVSRMARPGEGDLAALVKDAVAALAGRDSAAAQRQGALLVALLGALGEPVGGFDWAPLLGPSHEGTLPNAVLWADQEQAAQAKRLGETVLTSIVLASAGEHLSAEPVVVSRAVAGLRAVGLEAEARALAVEAAVAAGI